MVMASSRVSVRSERPSSSSSSRSVAHGSGSEQQNHNVSVRSKVPPSSRRSVTPTLRSHDSDQEPGRVRVAVRLRPKNAEDCPDADFADCIELQPEMKRLKLRKNNWSSESYMFDEVFPESASQKRVYEAVAKPVVESVLDGYNGTVMAYGQTGTGKTYTIGRLGSDDVSERGIMVRALEDIFANTSPDVDCVEVSYLQLYLESIQDLLAPEKVNIPIVEDPKNGEILLPGAAVVKICDLEQFPQLLQVGEANRHAANTKLNTESSRSHAILMVSIRRSSRVQEEKETDNKDSNTRSASPSVPTVRKSKLLMVDLAGSERVDKSGSEGHSLEEAKFINLSLTSLGKCINALAENCPHIPTRDSKLTRLLRDSFGGSARTSLIITIGPSARFLAETSSTIMFGQRAMKIVNSLKLKEEFDYQSQCRKLENRVDHLTAEIERQEKLRINEREELNKIIQDCQISFAEAEKSLLTRSEQHQLESSTYQKVLADTTQMYERKIAEMSKQLEGERVQSKSAQEQVDVLNKLSKDHQKLIQQHQADKLRYQKALADTTQMYEEKVEKLTKEQENEHAHAGATKQLELIEAQKEVEELKQKLQEMSHLHEGTVQDLQSVKSECEKLSSEKATLSMELKALRKKLVDEEKERKAVENEMFKLKRLVAENSIDIEDRKSQMKEIFDKGPSAAFGNPLAKHKPNQAKDMVFVGLQKIITLLKSEELDTQIHAVKVVANLAAEDINQEKIVEEGGLDALLMLVRSSSNATILRVASGAIANLAMNDLNQGLIISKGGAQLLATTASKTDDPQTLRMVAGALANLCGNESLHTMLKEDGGIKALLRMVRTGNTDVIAQVARGIANFAKCESRAIIQGHRKGHSLLIDDGTLVWLVASSNTSSTSTKRHIELALCHLGQNEENSQDFISSGALKELIRISSESSREDIRNLAKKTLNASRIFRAEMLAENL
ncbi:Kinesin motor domain [Dillenia turbinata]|uniref:Kinesin-like protein n=1 Tax=Dillenia turbinata TaxID=194707 RepID=A0AAN8V7X7_9MAGN